MKILHQLTRCGKKKPKKNVTCMFILEATARTVLEVIVCKLRELNSVAVFFKKDEVLMKMYEHR